MQTNYEKPTIEIIEFMVNEKIAEGSLNNSVFTEFNDINF